MYKNACVLFEVIVMIKHTILADTYSMVLEEGGVIKFTVPHHYEAKVCALYYDNTLTIKL